MTAAESREELRRDPAYWARESRRHRERKELEARLHEDEQPIVESLATVGIHVESVWDLVNTAEPYPSAIPVLLEHLPRPYDLRTKEGIARALTVKEARGVAVQALVREFKESTDTSPNGYRWSVGNALHKVAQMQDLDDLLKLVLDSKFGESRFMLVRALRRFKRDPRAIRALEQLASDPTVGTEATRILKQLG